MKFKDVQLPSNRTFGLFFTGVFAVVALYTLWHERLIWAAITGACSVGFLGVTLVAKDLLTPLNRLWMQFGLLLSKIVSPIVLGFLFYGLFTPIAMITRVFGRDELRLKRTKAASHWRVREPAGPDPQSFKNQF